MKRKQLLYLDFDGVLHPDAVYVVRTGVELRAPGHTLFEHANSLADALEPYPEVRIILSTSWVLHYNLRRAAARLPAALAERVVGATSPLYTRNDYFGDIARGRQVILDVDRRSPTEWLAIDDTDEGWTSQSREHLVLCKSDAGLGDPSTMEELQLKLQRFG